MLPLTITNAKNKSIQFITLYVVKGSEQGFKYYGIEAAPNLLDDYIKFFGKEYVVKALCAWVNKQCQFKMDESIDSTGTFHEDTFKTKILQMMEKKKYSLKDLERLRDEAIEAEDIERIKAYKLMIDQRRRER